MRVWGGRLGFLDPILINYVPVLAEAMRGWGLKDQTLDSKEGKFEQNTAKSAKGETSITAGGGGTQTSLRASVENSSSRLVNSVRVVYHCVDRWDAFAMYDSIMMGEMDRRCCRYADLVIASAGELYDRCRAINPNTVFIPHGVDWEHFHRAVLKQLPSNPATSSPPTIGFFGLLSEWVDQELLLRLAREFPEAVIQLIGRSDVPVVRLASVPNIRVLGPKPFSELPGDVAGFTVGIIPFVVNDLTRSVNPIKLREMLSAGCPVVSSALPEVLRYAGPAIQVAQNHDEFVAMVGRFIKKPLSLEERRALSDSMVAETWTAKVGDILGLLRGADAD